MAVARTYGTMKLADGHWELDKIEPHVTIRLKQIFPRIPKAAAPPFRLPNTAATSADLDWFTARYPLAIADNDVAALRQGRLAFETTQAELERILLPDFSTPHYAGLRQDMVLRHYQAQAVEVLSRSGGLLLGDEVGLGKTYVAAAACLSEGALPAVVVCQPHLQKQWASVIAKFTTLWPHMIKGTRPYNLPRADVYIFRYTQIVGWVDTLCELPIGLVTYDEVQELRRGTESMKGYAANRLSGKAVRRLGLSATPIYNYGAEIFSVMQFLRPEVLGDVGDFFREWCSFGKVSDPKALGSHLREQHAFLRRTKADVGQEMPAVNRIVDTIDYDVEAVKSIEALATQLAIKASTGSFVERGQAARDLDILVRQQTGVAKARRVAAVARIIVEGGTPIVLVGWHREVYAIWNDALADLKPAMYTGSETAGEKAREVERFISGDTSVLIMSLRSGAGLDGLQFRCSTMVFGELDWSPGVHHQCIGRLDREGQKEPVTAIFLVVDEGSDPPVMDILGLKASEAAQIVDPSLGVQAAHSDASHLQKLVQRYLSKRRAPTEDEAA